MNGVTVPFDLRVGQFVTGGLNGTTVPLTYISQRVTEVLMK